MPDSMLTLMGDTRPPPPEPPETHVRLAADCDAARETVMQQPDDADALIWLGRRAAYCGDFSEAAAVFSDGIARFPDDARFYRHRGHRMITLRRFDDAVRDLETAARLIVGTPDSIEPDGRPNPRATPTSTLHTNVWYHLALARYLGGDFAGALRGWDACLGASQNPDMLVATTYWLYLTLRRLGRDDEAVRALEPIRADLDVIENRPYVRLLQLFRGEATTEDLLTAHGEIDAPLDDATLGYGIGAWHAAEGRTDEADAMFRRVYAGPQWGAFGFIAAEADLARGG